MPRASTWLLACLLAAGSAAGCASKTDEAATADAPASAPPAASARVRPGIAALRRGHEPRLIAAVRVGRSAGGRPITVTASGNPGAGRRVLVVGCIHGDECAGAAVARRLQRGPRGCPPADADVWALANVDPDGHRVGSRLNGNGVDLNRNFPAGWQPIGRPGDPEHSGPRPFSEPETRTVRAIVRAFRPQITVWFHQQAGAHVRAWGPSVPAARRYARDVGLPFRRLPWLAGTAPHWQNTRFRGTASFVVELAPGPLRARDARRHARAIFALAAEPLAATRRRG